MNIPKVYCTCVLLVLLVLAGCGSSAYLTASGNFATAMDNSVSTLRSMKGLNTQLCEQRAQLDYLFHRITKQNFFEIKDGKPEYLYWSDYTAKFKYEVPKADGTSEKQTWETHCNQVTTADAVVDKVLGGLSAYANALKIVSTKDFSGKDVTSLAADANKLAGQLGAPSKATGIAGALANPLGQLSGVLLATYAKEEVNKVVKEADPSVTNILDGISKYIDALMAEESDAEDLMRNTIKAADARLSGDSMELLQFNELASRWVSDLQSKKNAQQTLSGALKKLRTAETALLTAGEQPHPDKAKELETVLGNAIIVIGDIQALNNAIQGKGGTNK